MLAVRLCLPHPASSCRHRTARPATGRKGTDLGGCPDSTTFVGRTQELALLHSWMLEECCRVVTLLGMGGIGKTSLAARLAPTLASNFDYVYWRNLRDAPPPRRMAVRRHRFSVRPAGVVARHQNQSGSLPCLSYWVPGAACSYRQFRDAAGGRPAGGALSGRHGWLRSPAPVDCRDIAPELLGLVDRYGGNGLALKIVGETIRQVYDGDIAGFVDDAVATSGTVFGGIRRLLDVQAERLSAVERDVCDLRLAVEREPISVAALDTDGLPSAARGTVVEAIENLHRRSLVERGDGGATFTLQSMVSSTSQLLVIFNYEYT